MFGKPTAMVYIPDKSESHNMILTNKKTFDKGTINFSTLFEDKMSAFSMRIFYHSNDQQLKIIFTPMMIKVQQVVAKTK